MFWTAQIKQLKKQFEEAKELGTAAAEEWIKGLEARGKQLMADASRWEKWQAAKGIHEMQKPFKIPKSTPSNAQNGLNTAADSLGQSDQGNSRDPLWQHQLTSALADENKDTHGNAASQDAHRPPGHLKRSKEEVAALKASRRAEIERRASLLDPPISPIVLSQIPSYQAALQIVAPMDDNGWELLKPRLLSQRKAAEERAIESVASARANEDRPRVTHSLPTVPEPTQPAREVPDSEWDEAQGPLRARIVKFADEIINDGWEEGDRVKKKTCAQFAAEVLLYVRKRFYAEVAKDAAAAIAAGKQPIIDPPEGPWTQKLTLENMKWLFDFKIRPFTERYRKELFVCNGCQGGRSYGLEAVIQHYAAKHTNGLSVGNVVVHWRAEWPEEPVFHPDPKNALPNPIEESHQPTANVPPAVYHPPGYHHQPPAEPPYGGVPPYHQTTPVPPGPTYPAQPYQAYPYYPNPYGYPQGPPPPHASNYYQWPPYGAPPYVPSPDAYGQQQAYPHQSYPPPESAVTHHQLAPHPETAMDHQNQRASPKPTKELSRPEEFAKPFQFIWKKLEKVKGLPHNIKIHASIAYAVKRFEAKFSEKISKKLLKDSILSMQTIRQLKGVHTLVCQKCGENPRITAKDTFSVVGIIDHCPAVHPTIMDSPDWHLQLVQIPVGKALADIGRLFHKQRAVKHLVEGVLPGMFKTKANNGATEEKADASSDESVSAGARVKEEQVTPEPLRQPISKKEKKAAQQPDQETYAAMEGNNRSEARARHVPAATSALTALQAPTRTTGGRYIPEDLDYGPDMYDDRPRQITRQEPSPRREEQTSRYIIREREPAREMVYYETRERVPESAMPQTATEDGYQRAPPRPDSHPSGRRQVVYSDVHHPAEHQDPNRHRSISPRRQNGSQQTVQYRDRSPAPVRYVYEGSYNDPRPQPVAEEYELVEVRDPHGDYFIRRPVRREVREVYYYDTDVGREQRRVVETRYPPAEHIQRVPSAAGYHHSASVVPARTHSAAAAGGVPSSAPPPPPQRVGSQSEYDDYDPRFPAVQNAQPPPPSSNMYQ